MKRKKQTENVLSIVTKYFLSIIPLPTSFHLYGRVLVFFHHNVELKSRLDVRDQLYYTFQKSIGKFMMKQLKT